MNKFLRVLFILVIIAMSGRLSSNYSFHPIWGSHSGYGISVGWQREIGIWNMAVLVILIAVNLKYDWFYLRTVLVALIIGGFGIGTNHLFSYFHYHLPVNGIGALENYLLVLGWIVGWRLESSRIKEEIRRSSRRAALFHLQFFLTKFVKKAYNGFVEFPEKENANHGNIKEIILWLL